MATLSHLRSVRTHIETALAHLDIDDLLDRLMNPRHTDHDRHVYLPQQVAQAIAAARKDIQAAIDELSDAQERS